MQLKIYTSLTPELAKILLDNPKVPVDIKAGVRVLISRAGAKITLNKVPVTEADIRADKEIMSDIAKMRARMEQIGKHKEEMQRRMQEYRLKEKESEVRIEHIKAQTEAIKENNGQYLDTIFNEYFT